MLDVATISGNAELSVQLKVCIESELAGDSRTLFRLRVNGKIIAEELTAVLAHLLVGEVLERIVLPQKGRALGDSLEGRGEARVNE